MHAGDGDAGIETRVYVDGVQEDAVAGNAVAIITVGFNTTLEIKTYSETEATAANSSAHAAGWKFV